MKSLKQYNSAGLNGPYISSNSLSTDIACPECRRENDEDVEMIISRPGVVLYSNPPQVNIHCPKCEHSTYMNVS